MLKLGERPITVEEERSELPRAEESTTWEKNPHPEEYQS